MRVFAAVIQLAGAAFVVAGVCMWSVPAAVVLAGLLALGFGVALERDAG